MSEKKRVLTLTNALGERWDVEVEIDLDGAAMRDLVVTLANRARVSRRGTASAAGGVVRVSVRPVPLDG